MSQELINEIRKIKERSFPELRQCYLGGLYIKSEVLQAFNSFGKTYYLDLNFNNSPRGIGVILIPRLLRTDFHHSNRTGIIAHELSHLVLDRWVSEQEVNEEAIRRGYGLQLAVLFTTMERLGIHAVHTSDEIFDILRSKGYKMPISSF